MPDNDQRLQVHHMSFYMTYMILMSKGPDDYNFMEDGSRKFGNCYTWMVYQVMTNYFFI